MNEILIAVLNMSIAASIVAVAVMLVRIPLKKCRRYFPMRYGPWCFCGWSARSALKVRRV